MRVECFALGGGLAFGFAHGSGGLVDESAFARGARQFIAFAVARAVSVRPETGLLVAGGRTQDVEFVLRAGLAGAEAGAAAGGEEAL